MKLALLKCAIAGSSGAKSSTHPSTPERSVRRGSARDAARIPQRGRFHRGRSRRAAIQSGQRTFFRGSSSILLPDVQRHFFNPCRLHASAAIFWTMLKNLAVTQPHAGAAVYCWRVLPFDRSKRFAFPRIAIRIVMRATCPFISATQGPVVVADRSSMMSSERGARQPHWLDQPLGLANTEHSTGSCARTLAPRRPPSALQLPI
jgi:hypothetical protein